MENNLPAAAARPGIFTRYRSFLLSKETIIAIINGSLLLAGFVVSIAGAPQIGQWLYLASAVIGGIPLFMLRPEQLVPVARRAEDLGFESVWVAEHLVFPTRIESRPPASVRVLQPCRNSRPLPSATPVTRRCRQ